MVSSEAAENAEVQADGLASAETVAQVQEVFISLGARGHLWKPGSEAKLRVLSDLVLGPIRRMEEKRIRALQAEAAEGHQVLEETRVKLDEARCHMLRQSKQMADLQCQLEAQCQLADAHQEDLQALEADLHEGEADQQRLRDRCCDLEAAEAVWEAR